MCECVDSYPWPDVLVTQAALKHRREALNPIYDCFGASDANPSISCGNGCTHDVGSTIKSGVKLKNETIAFNEAERRPFQMECIRNKRSVGGRNRHIIIIDSAIIIVNANAANFNTKHLLARKCLHHYRCTLFRFAAKPICFVRLFLSQLISVMHSRFECVKRTHWNTKMNSRVK